VLVLPFSGRFERWLERRSRARYELCDAFPSTEEQEAAEHYCLHRPLERPDTDARRAVAAAGIFFGATLALTWGLGWLLFHWDANAYLPTGLATMAQAHPTLWWVLLWLSVTTLGALFSLKNILIGMIRLYQHYASEDLRRRCIFQPTCSEYGILALQKHGVVVGLWKLWDRLVVRCQGNVYRIDYP